MNDCEVTQSAIKKGLVEVGLNCGDTVLVHSSMKAFGRVAGGPDAVIDALLEVIGNKGTLVMPTFTWRSNHARETVVFDVVNTKSEVGLLTEVFRNRKGVKRGIHVCHSFAAIGPHTEAVLGESKRPFGKGSPLDVLLKLNAWNLFLGVGFTSCTALHMAEENMRVPYRAYRDFKGSQVILPDGSKIPSESLEFLCKAGVDYDFTQMEAIFEKNGILRISQVGKARIINARIQDIWRVTEKLLKKDINFFLTKRPG